MSEYPQITIKHNIGNTIYVPNELDIKVDTYMSSNVASGVLALPVDNTTDFTAGAILLLLSSVGAENTEIVTSSSHTTLSFVIAATLMAHNRGDSVGELKYDQIVILKSSTIDGTYVTLSTQTFFVTQQNTVIYDSIGLTTDYYKVQWKNSVTGAVSDPSDPISVASYPENSVSTIVFPVLKAMGVAENDSKVTVEFCLSAVDDARKYTEAKLYGIRHAWQQVFEYPIKVLAGSNYIPLPEDIDYNETDRSVLAARFMIGNVLTPFNLKYIDKRSWNQIAFSVMGGTTTTAANITSVNVNPADWNVLGQLTQPAGTYPLNSYTANFQTYIGYHIVGSDSLIPAAYLPSILLMETYKGSSLSGQEQGGLGNGRIRTPDFTSTITLNSVGDFPNTASGVAYVETTAYTQTIMQIAYTSIDLTTNQLLGVTGITRDIPVGTRVWSRPTISQPIYYTVYSDKLVFDRIIPDSMQGNNIYIDYYQKMTVVTDLSQVLPEHYREIYKWYLRYAIKYRKDILLASSDPDLKKFEELVQALYNNLYTGQDTTIITS